MGEFNVFGSESNHKLQQHQLSQYHHNTLQQQRQLKSLLYPTHIDIAVSYHKHRVPEENTENIGDQEDQDYQWGECPRVPGPLDFFVLWDVPEHRSDNHNDRYNDIVECICHPFVSKGTQARAHTVDGDEDEGCSLLFCSFGCDVQCQADDAV